MKKVASLALCFCLSLTALFGCFGAKTANTVRSSAPQCDLPAVRVSQ